MVLDGLDEYLPLRFTPRIDTTSNRTANINRGASLTYVSGYDGL